MANDDGVAAFVGAAAHAADGDATAGISDDALAQVMTAAARLYAARAEATGAYPAPIIGSEISTTAVLTVISEMVRVIDVNLFDVSMWHARQGRR